jgi:hypothetical protein
MDSARRLLPEAIEALLSRVRSASPAQAAELFRKLPGRGGFVTQLRSWLEKNRSAFPEPFEVFELDSVHDKGTDLYLEGVHSRARVGFQIKSTGDLTKKDVTPRLKAQILDAQQRGVELFVVVFACTPSKKNLGIIQYWQNYAVDHPYPRIRCLSPEQAAGLVELFDHLIEPIVLSGRTWPDFFQALGKTHLIPLYLDLWPGLMPDQRFLPPSSFDSLGQAIQANRLTFLIGPPAAGKTFTAIQLLWIAFQEGRPVHWLTATDVEVTEGPIPRSGLDLLGKATLKSRVDRLVRTLGSVPGKPPTDAIDVISRVLEQNALVYIEDPFGKSEDEYALSLSSYDFFDFHRFVEELERSAKREGCRILVTSREPLFLRWLADLKAKSVEAPQHSVVLLKYGDYYPAQLFDHAVLLAKARNLDDPEAIADVLVEHVESPLEIDTLVRLLPAQAGVGDAEQAVSGWKGDLRSKIEGRLTPRDDREAIVLLLIAASGFRYDSLGAPRDMYAKLHSAFRLEGEPGPTFDVILERLRPFLASKGDIGPESRPFVPTHTVIREAIGDQLAAVEHRVLLRRIARALPDIPPRPVPKRRAKFFDVSSFMDPWADHFRVAHYLLSLGVALGGEEEAAAFETLFFDRAHLKRQDYRRMMELWHLLPERLRRKTIEELQRDPKKNSWDLREAAASLPRSQIDPFVAWLILELLLEEPGRGSGETMYLESPWAYLFPHLEEVPQSLREKLDSWVAEDPELFVYAMDKGLLLNWDRLPETWRRCLSDLSRFKRRYMREQLVMTTARYWGRAPQIFREVFDFFARSSDPSARALAGSRALFYAEDHADLEKYALEASLDSNPEVRLETFRWGRGDEAHRRVAEALLERATPGMAAEIMLDLLEEEVREEIVPWEREVLARCEGLGGDAAKAAIAYASFEGKERVDELGYKVAESPFEEPEIVRAAWLWAHLNSLRARPPLSDDDLKRLLQSIRDPKVRGWCLYYVSYQLTALPDSFQGFLAELSESSEDDAEAIREGARERQPESPRNTLRFFIRSLVD